MKYLGYAKNDPAGKKTGNPHNSKCRKSVRSINGEIESEIPRDRSGTFEPKLVRKGETNSTALTVELSRSIPEA